jgi:hypothetical protein
MARCCEQKDSTSAPLASHSIPQYFQIAIESKLIRPKTVFGFDSHITTPSGVLLVGAISLGDIAVSMGLGRLLRVLGLYLFIRVPGWPSASALWRSRKSQKFIRPKEREGHEF